ncbi:MAG: M50 family metallopeptidase [Pyrinomonadaceae bacterium]|nr:M50 family metallopeptidase [Pyrinomonadaceae bacterium]
MQYRVAKEAEPQFTLLLVATLLSIGLWIASWFIPLVSYVFYPLQIFATFIHEGGHVLATVLTGNSVQSLTVSPDGSGAVYSQGSGWLSQLLISSSGYLGTTAFGAAMLAWMRFGWPSRLALHICAGIIVVLTVAFGVVAPVFNLFSTVTLGGMVFTVFSGAFLAAVLVAVARYAEIKWVNFAVAFIAVQVLLNAIFSLVDLFFIATLTSAHSDAANMAAATGIPGPVWALIWIAVSVVMISVGLRVYAVNKNRASTDNLFSNDL